MCNCGQTIPNAAVSAQSSSDQTCSYTKEQLQKWREVLFCVKDQGLYTEAQTNINEINTALGITLSAINYRPNICYYKKELDKLIPLIHRIINVQQCQ